MASQAALQTPASLPGNGVENPAEVHAPRFPAFAASLAALTQAANAVALHKQNGKDQGLQAAVTKAQRQAAWEAFDALQTVVLNEGETMEALADALGNDIADARGVDPEASSYRVYRMRVRAFVGPFAKEIAKAGERYTVTRGKAKGEERNGREERDPLTVAKALLEARAENEARAKARAERTSAFGQAAVEAVAAKLSEATGETITPDDVKDKASLGMDDEAAAIRTMIDEEITRLADHGTLFTDFRAMLARFADASPEERAKAFELAYEAFASNEGDGAEA